MDSYNSLQIREVFHLEFLRWFGRAVKTRCYALKGGVNLRFFFKSIRYSEDMDLDISGLEVSKIKAAVLKLLETVSFRQGLQPFGIKEIVPPNMLKAKQTETTQRFKVHLITFAGEDLFTKVEFSRRGFLGKIEIETVSDNILRFYKLPPLLVPHYDANSAVAQKIKAIAARAVLQARDIFDLYTLITQLEPAGSLLLNKINKEILKKTYENIFEVDFDRFRDTVVSYLAQEDQAIYGNASSWEEIKLKTAQFIEKLGKKYA